jgi:hypothetical protein
MDMTYDSEVPRSILSPVAHGVQDRSSCIIQRLTHLLVPIERQLRRSSTAFVVAVIVLEVVDTPRCVRLRIDLLVIKRAEPATASVYASGRIDAELESEVVHLVREVFDAVRELHGVCERSASDRVPSGCLPTVVHNQVYTETM